MLVDGSANAWEHGGDRGTGFWWGRIRGYRPDAKILHRRVTTWQCSGMIGLESLRFPWTLPGPVRAPAARGFRGLCQPNTRVEEIACERS